MGLRVIPITGQASKTVEASEKGSPAPLISHVAVYGIQEAMENDSCHLHLQRKPRCLWFAWRQEGSQCCDFIPGYKKILEACQHNLLLFLKID